MSAAITHRAVAKREHGVKTGLFLSLTQQILNIFQVLACSLFQCKLNNHLT